MTGGTISPADVQHYRIAQQKADVEQDGSLTFTIVVAKAEWHGFDDGKDYESDGQRQLAGVSSPDGYERAEHRVIPSVPRENAIATMNAITPAENEIITQKSQSEGQEGSSDISFQRQNVYDYVTDAPGDTVNIDGTTFNAPSYSYDPETNVYSLSYNLVRPDKVQDLVDSLRAKLGSDPKIHVKNDGNGSYTVSVTGKALQPRHVREWVVEADWFQHQTAEQWIGVATNLTRTVGEGAAEQTIRGFYSEYETDAGTGLLVPVASSWIPLAVVRGDLDADWMGSDPQSQGAGSRAPILYYSIGVDDAKEQRSGVEHDDEHGDGWSGSNWTDPGAATDAADKARSHVLTRVNPRVNGDGTLDLSITRIYPHQRRWEWETKKRCKNDSDWRTVYHVEYRNWPSRHSIESDLLTKFAEEKGIDLDSNDYVYSFSPNVNQFGLVDAANVTIEPIAEGNGNKGSQTAEEGITDGSTYRFYRCGRPVQCRLTPDAAVQKPPFAPALGYFFSVMKTPIYYGAFEEEADAWKAWRGLVGADDNVNGTSVLDGRNSSEPALRGGMWHFKYVGTEVPGPAVYNGWPPVPAGSERSQHTVNPGTPNTLSRKTWELWYQGHS